MDNPIIATRDSWFNLKPMPTSKIRLTLRRTFSQEEYSQIIQGVIPGCMEDKWFIFHENNTVYFHRNWTGFCIYLMKLEKEEEVYAISEAWANRDSEDSWITPKPDHDYDVAMVSFLIDNLLLKKEAVTFPIPKEIDISSLEESYRKELEEISMELYGDKSKVKEVLLAMYRHAVG